MSDKPKKEEESDPLADLDPPAITGLPNEFDTIEEWAEDLIAKAWDEEEDEPSPRYADAVGGLSQPDDEDAEADAAQKILDRLEKR